MKSYTDLEQSKRLAEFLPLESADMWYSNEDHYKIAVGKWEDNEHDEDDIPCWSLTALLDVLPKTINHNTLFIETSPALWHIGYRGTYIARSENLIDTAYEMILKLHKLNFL